MPEQNDILRHLEQEHRKVEGLFDDLAGSQPGQRRNALVQELTDALDTHMEVEERFVYPLVSQQLGREERTEATNEHELARQGLASLHQLRDQPGFEAAVEMLKSGVGHHVHEEESEIFPELREKAADAISALDPDDLEQQVRSGSAPPAEAATDETPAKRPARTSSKNDVDIDLTNDLTDDLTKDELYKRAQKAEIPGRSSMTKAELIDALNDA